jgi:hypothetical protein
VEHHIGAVVIVIRKLHVAAKAMACLDGSAHKVKVLFKTQRRIPVFTRPGVVRFTKNHISFAIELSVPIKM